MEKLDRFIMRALGGGDMHNSPPGDWLAIDFGDMMEDGKRIHYARTGNDGYEIWIGSPYIGWKAFFRMPDALTLARFIIWRWWVVGTWCGMRRRIWYAALKRDVSRKSKGGSLP